ncbi:hypothetical protein Droror1_Dr00013523 [Drosera rotundifolia]
MATILANLSSPVLIHGVKILPRLIFKSGFCPIPDCSLERRGRVAFLTKAAGESSETLTSLSIVGSVQKVWDKSEDRVGLIGLGFAGIVALWASVNLISAIDKVPVIPSLFEFIGILYSAWFTYRYLLFKPDREEFIQNLNKSVSGILGQ